MAHFAGQAQKMRLVEPTYPWPQHGLLLAWDERALIDWESGMQAAVHRWLGPNRPAPARAQLVASLRRAEEGARASKPDSFLEMMRRIYLSLAQDLAFAPRPLDLLELESEIRAFMPRPGVVELLGRVRNAGLALAWLQESGDSVATAWRARVGVPFEQVIELGPVHSSIERAGARAMLGEGRKGRGEVLLIRNPGRESGPGAQSLLKTGGFAGRIDWPAPLQSLTAANRGQLDPEWWRRLQELIA